MPPAKKPDRKNVIIGRVGTSLNIAKEAAVAFLLLKAILGTLSTICARYEFCWHHAPKIIL